MLCREVGVESKIKLFGGEDRRGQHVEAWIWRKQGQKLVLSDALAVQSQGYDEESDHSNKAVRKTPEIESGHKVSEEVKWT